MPRQLRPDFTDLVVHIVNRAANRAQLFFSEYDYAAMERVLIEAQQRFQIRLIAYCIMPNHWHLVVWARNTEGLSGFMKWLTQVHAARWRRTRDSTGVGAVYQSRYKAFPMSSDEHLFWVCRYVERNAARASLVPRAEDWQWGSLWYRTHGSVRDLLSPSPVPFREDWLPWVNEPQTTAEVEAVRKCIDRDRPFGPDRWVQETVKRLGLQHTLRHAGRPGRVSHSPSTCPLGRSIPGD